jgi:hypothetical protein
LPAGIKAKALNVVMGETHLKAGVRGRPPVVDAALHRRVIAKDSFWTVEDGELIIALQKENKSEWWKCVCVGDVEIDTSSCRHGNDKLDELNTDTRRSVDIYRYDQRQTAFESSSSDDQKKKMVEMFMAAHPEMDFSKAKFN